MKNDIVAPYFSKEFIPPKPTFENEYYAEKIEEEFYNRAALEIMGHFDANQGEFEDYLEITKKLLSPNYKRGYGDGYDYARWLDNHYMFGCDENTVELLGNIFYIKRVILSDLVKQWEADIEGMGDF